MSRNGLGRLNRPVTGVVIVLAVIGVLEALRLAGAPVPNPPAPLMIALVYAAFVGGLGPGLACAGLCWAYTAWHFFVQSGFAYPRADLIRVIVWGVAMPTTAILVGVLYRRAKLAGAQDESRRNAAAMHRNEENRRLVVEHAMDGVVILDENGRVTDWNPAAEEIFGRPKAEALGQPFAEMVLDEDARPEFMDGLADLMRRPDVQTRRQSETFALRHDGKPFPAEVSMFPLHANGTPACGVFIRDLTDRWVAARRNEALMRELDHRVKNNLAAVLSIVDQTASRCEDIDDFIVDFRGRLMAMARLHSSLAASRWSGADLHTLVRQTVEPYTQDTEGRVVVRGSPVVIPSSAVSSVSMALHELATNASRYGALSVHEGRVLIEWRIEAGPDGRDRLRFLWIEEGGPPVDAPSHYGFGRQLIEEGVRYEARGQTNLTFSPTGVTCELLIPLSSSGAAVAE